MSRSYKIVPWTGDIFARCNLVSGTLHNAGGQLVAFQLFGAILREPTPFQPESVALVVRAIADVGTGLIKLERH